MAYEQISYRVEDRMATLTLQRPDARNGYTVQMADELAAALVVAGEDDDVRVVVLTGAGTDFCVGADLSGGGRFALADHRGRWVVVYFYPRANTPG